MDEHVEETVPAAFDGDRVDRFVAAVTALSRSAVKTLIDEGRVSIDGRRAKTAYEITTRLVGSEMCIRDRSTTARWSMASWRTTRS